MKKILLVCGAGVATSTVVKKKVEDALNERGYKGQYMIVQGKAAEVDGKSSQFDLVVSTTMLNKEICHCPLIIGTQFLIGRDTEPIVRQIIDVLGLLTV